MLKLTRIAAVLLIALAAILAVVAFGVSRRASQAPAAPAQTRAAEAPTWPVVEAVNALPAGLPIAAKDLRVAGRAQPVAGGFTTVADVVGAVPTRDIAAGTALDGLVIAQGYALRLNPGERALAVPVDELVAAGNRIQPGDFVDVFLNLRATPGVRDDGDAQARLLLSRLRVLSYGADDLGTPAPATPADAPPADSRAQDITQRPSSSRSGDASTTATARSAVLAVPVADASRLLLGAQQGKLFLALRNPADVGQPDLALFAQPAGVLAPRRELTPEQRLALQSPENDAYAGIDSAALAGRGGARPAPVASTGSAPRRSAPRLDRGVEIIRGDASSPSGSP
ncbi:Flp pilus assembly protein CpaB [Stenotrophomonas sp. GZD-301]|uniref:Flp pilus assembly protein CpaB n=1 Tax=Stenotrophomonas sp. GZD-301 TaxID=3404814 RepID=UPI003BB4E2F5